MVMMLTKINKTNKRVVGTKQTLKAITNEEADKVYIAKDIDQHIKEQIFEASKKYNVSVVTVESKLKLGRVCGIDVSAACATVLK